MPEIISVQDTEAKTTELTLNGNTDGDTDSPLYRERNTRGPASNVKGIISTSHSNDGPNTTLSPTTWPVP